MRPRPDGYFCLTVSNQDYALSVCQPLSDEFKAVSDGSKDCVDAVPLPSFEEFAVKIGRSLSKADFMT